jgi:hypothetical protein
LATIKRKPLAGLTGDDRSTSIVEAPSRTNMYAWQFAKRSTSAGRPSGTRFRVVPNPDILVYREEEREMIPLRINQGTGAITGARKRALLAVPVRVRAAHLSGRQ